MIFIVTTVHAYDHCGSMMEEQDTLGQMSGDYSGSTQATLTINDYAVHLPVYISFLSLGFRIVSTAIIVVMAGWIIITIKTTQRLHKIHNVYIAHLMATDAITALTSSLLSGLMIFGYFIGIDFISCNVMRFLLFPVIVINLTFSMISVDKLIAITFPLRYHQIMKPRVVFGIITTKWVLAILLFIPNLFNTKGFTKVAKFGTCLSNGATVFMTLTTFILPVFLACFFTAVVNIFLTIKAYQVHKQIQEESKLSGGHSGNNDQLKTLKKKQATIRKHRKPMITLLVVVLGTSSLGILFPLLYIPTVFIQSPSGYKDIIQNVIIPNLGNLSVLFHPFVYGLYFKQIREPMIRLLKRITCPCKCKSAVVAPQSQRDRMKK